MADITPESVADFKSEPLADLPRNLEASVRSCDADVANGTGATSLKPD